MKTLDLVVISGLIYYYSVDEAPFSAASLCPPFVFGVEDVVAKICCIVHQIMHEFCFVSFSHTSLPLHKKFYSYTFKTNPGLTSMA